MVSSRDYCLRPARTPHIVGFVIGSIFPATWLLERLDILNVGRIAWHPLWTLFVFGFVCPVCLLLLYIAWRRDPVILLSGDSVCLRHVALPWRTAKLSLPEIHWVTADWYPNSSHCCLKMNVDPSCFERTRRQNSWLCRKDGFLTLYLNNTEETPDQVAATVNCILSESQRLAR